MNEEDWIYFYELMGYNEEGAIQLAKQSVEEYKEVDV